MITTLRTTTIANEQQDWLKTNLARASGRMQGQRDLLALAQLIMSELTPVVDALVGAFFLAEPDGTAGASIRLRLIGGYGYQPQGTAPEQFALGEGLVGQAGS